MLGITKSLLAERTRQRRADDLLSCPWMLLLRRPAGCSQSCRWGVCSRRLWRSRRSLTFAIQTLSFCHSLYSYDLSVAILIISDLFSVKKLSFAIAFQLGRRWGKSTRGWPCALNSALYFLHQFKEQHDACNIFKWLIRCLVNGKRISKNGVWDPRREWKKPYLGVCLGMQALLW